MKKLKLVIYDALLIVFGVLMLSFGAGYYLAGLGSGVEGYNFLQTLLERLKTASNAKAEVYFYVIGMILVLVFVSLLIVLAVLSLLCNFNVIKNDKFAKVLKIVKLVSVAIVLVAFIFVLSSVLSTVKNSRLTVGYGLIMNVIWSVLTVALLVVEMLLARKK